MTINIMEKYIELTKKQIEKYMQMIFQNEYREEYCKLLIEKYINVRYYNLYEDSINGTIRSKIIQYLKQTEEDLIINNILDREIIEKMIIIFYYVMYFDNVIVCKNLREKIEKIIKLCKRINIYKDENFANELYNEINRFNIEKELFLDKFESNEFYLKLSHYSNSKNVCRINLKQNIKFPMEYSELAIIKAFNTGLINEDKLVIEYYLTSVQILKDIINRNYRREYIVEFASSLLKKIRKVENTLSMLDSFATQEKVILKIRYEDYTENIEKVYELMRNGYKFAVIIDSSFELETNNIEKLKVFKYILISEEQNLYKEFMRRTKNILSNIIEI